MSDVPAEQIKIGYLGPDGTFSHAAARSIFGANARYAEEATIEGVFDAVSKSQVTYGVVPIENSSEGSVTRAVDALLEGNGVLIRGELEMAVSQCLITRATELASIERVCSHPQALGQCRLWLSKNLPHAQVHSTSSTTAAVREAALDARTAAIASGLASEIYGVPVARESIQDSAENITRFVIIGHDDVPRTGSDKTTLTFSVKNSRGALRRVLEIFDEEAVSLTRIESRPSHQKAWDYIFLVDLEGHREDPSVTRSMARLAGVCVAVRSLGSYPRSRT
ncbi:MAG: prephenate dehydratase [Polyangiaceae bacterium]